ncbi:EH domain-containing 1-like [Olea europaea subsp. europaea]|uniref:EH domain-containing 1-like n=1 Tax=Olea europaea subsp. europaea TaxID=158383 RepID=A0A8S0SX50_OLEEU|nr:EH domain-containing 1-like [Olea europaea subsp. europaea]
MHGQFVQFTSHCGKATASHQKVWAIADSKREGFLGYKEFITAMQVPLNSVTSIMDGLKRLYVQKLKPLEVTYQFNDFVSPLLVKMSFCPSGFIVELFFIQNGPDERSVPGTTIAVQADMPFNGLTTFGTALLSKFECSRMPHPLLEHTTLVNTPRVLSGEKQRTLRSYNFVGVKSWFAAKCDLILLLFDPYKLDICDEFKCVILSLRGRDDKIRVVLNKADQVDAQQVGKNL